MDPSPDEIGEVMEVTGLEAREAEAWIYLWRAEGIFKETYSDGKGMGGTVFMGTQVTPHFHVLRNILGTRVLGRQYPQGWMMEFELEDNGSEE